MLWYSNLVWEKKEEDESGLSNIRENINGIYEFKTEQ